MPLRLLEGEGLSFDDVLLVPRFSNIGSRYSGEIDFSTNIFPAFSQAPVVGKMKYPLISANMDTVTGHRMAKAMDDLGGLGIVHRFMDVVEHEAELVLDPDQQVACIGTGVEEFERFEWLRPSVTAVLIDVAHGHSQGVVDQILRIKKTYPWFAVIAGNVATGDGVKALVDAGVDCVKVGVGPGSLCSTRIQTGCGVPQLTAISWARDAIDKSGQKIGLIADGGIKSSGDAMKALAAGADAVMIGNLFAGTDEAPGKTFLDEGFLYKNYRGMASRQAQEEKRGKAKSVEGVSMKVPCKGPVAPIFEMMVSRMLSSMSYMNARSLFELRENALFIRQTPAGFKESMPHGLMGRM